MDEEVVGEGAQDPGRVEAKSLQEPGAPTERERKIHDLTHLPYRSWCWVCRMARGYTLAHLHSDEMSEVPIVAIDYFFLGEQEQPGCMACLCIKECQTKAIVAITAPRKGRHPYVEHRIAQALRFFGHKRIIIRSDQEHAICALIEAVAENWTGEIMHEKSPVGDHRANGWVESGVRTTEAQVRAVKLALEDRYKMVLDHTHPIVTWIVEYSGWLITRFGLGRHGKTPYRMLRGRDALSPLCEFGECVLYKPAGATRARGKLQAMLKEGMFLGRTHSSGENIIGTPDGIVKARDVYRRTASERYDVEMLKTISGTPWKMTTVRDVEAEEIPEFRVLPAGSRRPEEHADNIGEAMPRRVKLTREVMERFSYTPRCPGCINLRLGKYHRAHNEECRSRVEELLRQDAQLRWRVEAASARQDAWTERERAVRAGEIPEGNGTLGPPGSGTLGPTDGNGTPEPMEGEHIEVNTPPLPENLPRSKRRRVPEVIHIPDVDIPEVIADEEADAFMPEDVMDRNLAERRKRAREVDESIGADEEELIAEEEVRGEMYTRRDAAASSSSTSWIARSDPYQRIPIQTLELVHTLESFGADKDQLMKRVIELNEVVVSMGAIGVDVSEIYSPPRVVALATRYGLRPGFSLDLSVNDECGKPWDFTDPAQRDKAREMVTEQKPWLIIGSPPCTKFSILQNLNISKRDPIQHE